MNFTVKILPSFFVLVLVLFAASPASADDKIIVDSCKKDLQLSESECSCVLTEVNNNLNPNQLKLFLAMIQGNGAAIAQAQSNGQMSGDDMLFLTNFMATTPTKCKS